MRSKVPKLVLFRHSHSRSHSHSDRDADRGAQAHFSVQARTECLDDSGSAAAVEVGIGKDRVTASPVFQGLQATGGCGSCHSLSSVKVRRRQIRQAMDAMSRQRGSFLTSRPSAQEPL